MPHHVVGIDEAGRGPLAGPVVAAAVILDPAYPLAGLADSKQLTARQRERLFSQIQQYSIAWAIGRADVAEIDRINILQASLLAMQRAVQALAVEPQHALVDGRFCPALSCSAEAIVRGDQSVAAISAASIMAKVTRDQDMHALDTTYPGYGFAQHKGYGTPQHMTALQRLGPCPIHRRTFAPVAACL